MEEIKLFDEKKYLNRQTIEEKWLKNPKQSEGLMNDFLVSQSEQQYQ